MSLEGPAGAEDLGILMAEYSGFFADAGMEVRAGAPFAPNRPVSYVASSTVEFAVARLPEVVMAKEEDAPIVVVGSLLSRSTASLIWLKKSRVRALADLEGKTIAIPGIPFEKDFLRSVLARAELSLRDVRVKEVGFELVPALLDGRADAVFGGSGNLVAAELQARGAKQVVTGLQELGIPEHEELAVITRTELAAKNPKLVRGFMTAIARGTAAAIANPRDAVTAIDIALEKNPETTHEVAEAQVEDTVPLLSTSGEMDPRRVQRLIAWMHSEGMIQRAIPATSLLFSADR